MLQTSLGVENIEDRMVKKRVRKFQKREVEKRKLIKMLLKKHYVCIERHLEGHQGF